MIEEVFQEPWKRLSIPLVPLSNTSPTLSCKINKKYKIKSSSRNYDYEVHANQKGYDRTKNVRKMGQGVGID